MTGLERFPRRAGVATLTDRVMLSPAMARVTLTCADFGPAWPVEQPGEIITLLFTPPGEEIVLPERGWRFPGGSTTQEWRNYTVRRHRPETGQIDVDVVLHEPPGAASRWAVGTSIGGPVGYAGPRIDYVPDEGADWLLLCGDETALPAIAAIAESAPDSRELVAVVEIADAGEELAVDLPPRARIEWVHRRGAPAGTTSHLADAVRRIELPGGSGQAWGAAESRIARDLRAVLRGERGMPATQAKARGYWLRTGDWLIDEEE